MIFKIDFKYKMFFCELGVESMGKDREWKWLVSGFRVLILSGFLFSSIVGLLFE